MILVYGKTGQVARELQELERDARYLSRSDADFTKPKDAASFVRELQPDAVIVAAAFTAVDQAESDQELATCVNAEAPAAIAAECAAKGIPIVYISTDYVFDGEGEQPFSPGDAPNPLNAYGRTKLQGEEAVSQSGAPHAILRTSWVFSRFGKNFVKSMVSLGKDRSELSIVADQIGGPTPASAIAHASLTIAKQLIRDKGLSGTYHFAGTPDVSWADFARTIFDIANLDVAVKDIPSSEFPVPAKRPQNSRLDCSDLAKFGIERPYWRDAIPSVVKEAMKP